MANKFEHDSRTVIDRYKKKKTFDWDTLWGTIFLLFVFAVVLNSCVG